MICVIMFVSVCGMIVTIMVSLVYIMTIIGIMIMTVVVVTFVTIMLRRVIVVLLLSKCASNEKGHEQCE
jgi:hypothetical protein